MTRAVCAKNAHTAAEKRAGESARSTIPELAPFAHGAQHEHGDDRSARGGEDASDRGADRGRERAVARALQLGESEPDQPAGETADEDGDEGDHTSSR